MGRNETVFGVSKGDRVSVNGRALIVAGVGNGTMSLRGVRGGRGYSVERNVHSGALLFATPRGTELVESFEVAS